jgi:SAM-dependent methyltransferase
MTEPDLAARIAAFPRWHYAFDLRGHSTVTPGITRVKRHAQRLPYLFNPLLEACGGTLAGLRVLDLGCNAGFWSLHALRRGADFVLGVDARATHVSQAARVGSRGRRPGATACSRPIFRRQTGPRGEAST